jgi:hypothetical protein
MFIEERFWSKVDKKSDDECWEWTASKTKDGYGYFHPHGTETVLAHRQSYEMFVGKIPKGMYVCHHCDNPPCVNPNHLFLGNQLDNMRDMLNKGRKTRKQGIQHPKAKLTENDVLFIRETRINKTHSQKELATMFNVAVITIDRVSNRRNWKHLP